MHEFSLAQNILEIAEESIEKNNMIKVTSITLEIGSMAGIEIYALQTALEIIQQGTVLEKAIFSFNILKAKAVCNSCHHPFEPHEITDPCPECANYGMKIISGKELIVKSIEAE